MMDQSLLQSTTGNPVLPEGQRRLPSPPEPNVPRSRPPQHDASRDVSPETIDQNPQLPPSHSRESEARTSRGNGHKRRGRPMVSCAECRRRRLKCDRSVPCSNCIKRDCSDICPSGTRRKLTTDAANYERRLSHLESLLRDKTTPNFQGTESHTSGHASPSPPPEQNFAPPRQNVTPPHTDENPSDENNRQQPSPIIRDGMTDHPRPPESVGFHGANSALDHGFLDNLLTTMASPPGLADVPSVNLRQAVTLTSEHAPVPQSADDEPLGTLVVDDIGRSRYLGPRAGTEWLQNQERPDFSRATSVGMMESGPSTTTSFPYGPLPTSLSKTELFSKLPATEETPVLIESYFRSFVWNLSPITRPAFDALFEKAYRPTNSEDVSKRIHIHQIALLFAIFAMGAHHCLEYPPNDPIVEEYIKLAKTCLSQGDFLVKNTIPGLQALTLIGHLSTETERGRRGDLAWPLYGLAMRLVQAMGLHRDGSKWNLPQHVIEERRLVFWECYTIDVFQAHCFSRPPLMRANHFDTRLPPPSGTSTDVIGDDTSGMTKGYKSLKYELVKILATLLDLAMDISPPSYEQVLDQYNKICGFECSIPYHLRCRDALVATISRYPTPEDAICISPPVNRRDLKRTFEQFTLAMHVSEAILFLQRPYYAKAMNENPADPVRSQYGVSFLAVLERCNVVTQIVRGLTDLYPAVASRHWFYWYHLFNAAVCVGTLVLRCPHSPIAPLALSILDEAITAYSVVTRQNTSATLNSNHEWLLLLRRRCMHKISQISPGVPEPFHAALSTSNRERPAEDVDEELLGWRTRLIERVVKSADKPRATTITGTSVHGSSISVDIDLRTDAMDSATPYLSTMFTDEQLLSADLMMNQHFAMS